MISNKNYVVVSTIKNELDNFENQLVDLENQTIQPECWVVYVDDTNLRLYQNISNKHRIKVYLIKKKPDMERLYYRRLAINMNHAFNSVKKLGLEASYYLKLDGDIRIPEKDYIEKLFGFLENNPEYASVSGAIKTIGERDPKRYNDYPLGAAMLFSQELIEYWNGYPIYPASDTVLNVTAEVLWKKCKLYEKAYFIQNRPTSSRVSVSPTVSTAIKHYFLRYPKFLTYLYVLKEDPKNLFKYMDWVKTNKERIEPLRINDKDWIKVNIIRLKQKPIARLVMGLFGEK